ncbi:TIM-barrel domain-containing protein [Thermaurantimonas aggregans]|nr:TIM-barrel domain-containing protein [Thermaurantimonas aggregans]MCX8149273.1 glycosyl hydrolase [Thermaurantimonas aggregans]
MANTSSEPSENILQISSGKIDALITQPIDDVIRIQIFIRGRKRIINPYSTVVNDKKTLHIQKIKDGFFEVNAGKYKVLVYENPFRVSFYTYDGELIHNDADLGIQIQENGITVLKELQQGERFIGLGEKTGPIDRRGWQYTHWNTDAFAYHQEFDPLYSSIPFYIGINGHLPYGIFVNNSCRTDFNFGASNDRFSFFRSADGYIDYYFIYTGDIKGIVSRYLDLTGRPELPPVWALGYQQCRYSYYPEEELLLLADTFRKKKIPCDVLYLDIHYMDEYKVFTWDKERFKDPKKFLADLKDKGFKVVIIQDPGIKVEEGYGACDSGIEEDVFVKYPDGKLYVGEAWPGRCYFPDFTNERARNWWKRQMKAHFEEGVAGFWNDMNEPAVWGKHFPDFIRFNYDGQQTSHLHAHNVYGMQMVRATYEAQKEFRPDKRPFALTRAAFAGTQRYAWKWTGDNISNEEHLLLGQRLINSLSLSGYFFSGNDVGGFIGECWPELFMRWIAVGAFNPFFRGHSMINSRDHEPWSFGEEAEEVSRNFITLRYKLLPYLYSAFYRAVMHDEPINRPMAFTLFNDERSFSHTYGHQFFVGPSILVCPVLPGQAFGKVWLPEGNYYEMFTGKVYTEGEHVVELHRHRIPVFVRAGHALMSAEASENAEKTFRGIYQFHLYKGDKASSGFFYIDEGDGYGYKNGEYSLIKWEFIPGDVHQWNIQQVEGNSPFDISKTEVYLHGYTPTDVLEINKKKPSLESTEWMWIAPVSSFDPYFKQSDQSTIIKVLKVSA